MRRLQQIIDDQITSINYGSKNINSNNTPVNVSSNVRDVFQEKQ